MELHDDDKPIGRVLTRRETLKLLGGAGAVMVTGAGLFRFGFAQAQSTTPTVTPGPTLDPVLACVAKPELTEGPYFVDEMLNRSDIRVDSISGLVKEGLPLLLTFSISDVTDDMCKPLAGAQVDIWHCDAEGVYSDVQNAVGQNWLRGYQITDENGYATFQTIYPGWYPGRAVHIHFKIRTDPESDQGYEFTSQLFFDDDVSAEVYTQAPYQGTQNVLNAQDGIYQQSEGLTVLDLVQTDEGYSAVFGIGLDLSAPTQSETGGAGGSGGGRGGPGGPGRGSSNSASNGTSA